MVRTATCAMRRTRRTARKRRRYPSDQAFRANARERLCREESNMRNATKWLTALGLIGAAVVSVPVLTVPTPASAQIFFGFGGPGIGVGVGPGWYGDSYYYGAPYSYGYYGRPYWHHRYHHYRW